MATAELLDIFQGLNHLLGLVARGKFSSLYCERFFFSVYFSLLTVKLKSKLNWDYTILDFILKKFGNFPPLGKGWIVTKLVHSLQGKWKPHLGSIQNTLELLIYVI